MHLLTTLFTLSVAVSPLLAAVPSLHVRDMAIPNPSSDPFYVKPDNLSDYALGDVIRTREIQGTVSSDNLASTMHLYYRSSNTHAEADGTVTTVFIPKKPASPPKILAMGVWEDSASFDCAPSWAFVNGSASAGTIPSSLDTPIYISWALNQGYYVTAADHEGSVAGFIVGRQSGRATLDGVRALKNYASLPHDTGTVALGYSGAAHATVWASALAQTYAPDVNMIGAAHGGTPIDLQTTFLFLNAKFFAGFAGAGLVGAANAYPDIDDFLQTYTTDAGKAAIKKYRSSGYCLVKVATGDAGTDFFSLFTKKDPLNDPLVQRVFKKESLLANVSAKAVPVPSFPTFQFHAESDEIVPLGPHAQFVSEQCKAGANINYMQANGEHILGEVSGVLPSIQWMAGAFAGTFPASTCNATTTQTIDPKGYDADAILGPKLAKQYRAAVQGLLMSPLASGF